MIAIGALFTVMALLPALLILWQRLQALDRQLQDEKRTGRATVNIPVTPRAIYRVPVYTGHNARGLRVTRKPQAWQVVDIEAKRMEVK